MDGNNSLKRSTMFADRVAADTRVLADSLYFCSQDYVDRFAGEVRGRQSKGPRVKLKNTNDSDNSDEEDVDVEAGADFVEGDSTDGLRLKVARAANKVDGAAEQTQGGSSLSSVLADNQSASPPTAARNGKIEDAILAKLLVECVKNWKAASEDQKQKMWVIFEECGIFAAAYRHRLMLWIIDMMRSGELYVLLLVSVLY